MNLPIIGQAQHAAHIPGDPGGYGAAESWAAAVAVDVHGWWSPSQDEINANAPGRRSQEVAKALMVPLGTACGDRDRWTLPGGETLEQVGEAQDASHGPWGMAPPLVVYLATVEG